MYGIPYCSIPTLYLRAKAWALPNGLLSESDLHWRSSGWIWWIHSQGTVTVVQKKANYRRDLQEGNHSYELHLGFFKHLQYVSFATPKIKGIYAECFVNSKARWPCLTPKWMPHWFWRNWNFVLGNLSELPWSGPPTAIGVFKSFDFQPTFPQGSFWKSPCSGLPFDGKRCAFRKSATCTQQPGWCWEIYWFKSRHSIAWAGTMLVWVALSERLHIKHFQWARDQ